MGLLLAEQFECLGPFTEFLQISFEVKLGLAPGRLEKLLREP